MTGDRLITLRDAAVVVGVSETDLRNWAARGKIPATKVAEGKRMVWRIASADLGKIIDSVGGRGKAPKGPDWVAVYAGWKRAAMAGYFRGASYSERTLLNYELYIGQFFKLLGVRPSLGAITRENYHQAMALIADEGTHKGKNFERRRHLHQALVSLLKYAVGEGFLNANPLAGIKQPRSNPSPVQTVTTRDELARMLRAAEEYHVERDREMNRAILELVYETGLRVNEVCHLRMEELHLDERFLTVHWGKGGKGRQVPLSARAVEVLRHWLAVEKRRRGWVFLNEDREQMTPKAVYLRWRRLAKRAGVKSSPHCGRRGCLTEWFAEGIPPMIAQKAVGHKDLRTTLRYAQLTPLDGIKWFMAREEKQALASPSSAVQQPPELEDHGLSYGVSV